MTLFSLKNKVAVVTGALGLLGKEHCIALNEAGATIVVADIDKDGCERYAREFGPKSIGVRLDVNDKGSIEEALCQIEKTLGPIDVLINNAAINDKFENPVVAGEKSRLENYPEAMWRAMIDVNVTGVFLCAQVLGSSMARQGKGSIINIASTYGIVGPDQDLYKDTSGKQLFFKSPAYSASKGAVIALTRYLATYWGNSGVRVNTLSPGGVENQQDEYFVQSYSKKTPLGRMATPGDYRGAIVFLASEASAYMTGANLVVDGGWTAW